VIAPVSFRLTVSGVARNIVSKNDFSKHQEKGALSVAARFGNVVTPRQVVKSLMFETGSDEIILVLVGGDQNVISGSLKKVVGDRNVRMASRDRIHDVTGYQVDHPPFSWQPRIFEQS